MNEADAASAAAKVTVRLLDDVSEHHTLSALFAQIWEVPEPSQVLDAETIRALRFAGNYVVGAFSSQTMVAGSVAFMGLDGHLHSHIAGVTAKLRGQGVGYAVKLHQRQWALRHGITSIQWTFDPARARNARFNLHRLGATVSAYLPDFYGEMTGFNAGTGPSDRLLVDWRIDSERVRAALAEGLDEPGADATVPISSRDAVRQGLQGLYAEGYHITGVTSAGEYALRRQP